MKQTEFTDSSPADSRHEEFDGELLASMSSEILHLIILPTEQCNFRCTYCYEDFAIGRMSPATVTGIKRLIDRRRDDLRALNVSWFGGEPLLAREIIEDVSTHIMHAVDSREELSYSADMTTNGYLLDSHTTARLADLGIRFHQVSLDGPEALHNRTRVRADGNGSFERIWRNLVAIRDSAHPVRVLLRVHLTPANLPSMPEFLVQVRDTFLHDARFSVYLKPIERMGGPNDAAMAVIDDTERPGVIAELESILIAGREPQRLFDAPKVCYASRPNSLVIRANGRIGKCTVALSDPSNTVGQLLPDGSLQIDNGRLRPWLRGWSARDWDTIGCPYGGMARDEPALLQIGPPASKAAH
ncbi:radical SAM protein [Streptomyces sp. NBC_00122]|uniref:radical SAM protein n=1 Tax=Streptomyces sp. NBC_00122 TaxID=2903623 RepID=UPI002F909187